MVCIFIKWIYNLFQKDISPKKMSETAYIDELLKAEEEANNIIQNAQK